MQPNSLGPTDDIPEAQRDGQIAIPAYGRRRGLRRWITWFLVGLLSAVAGLLVSWLTYQGTTEPAATAIRPLVSSSPPPPEEIATRPGATDGEKSLLGHRAYEEAEEAELVPLAYNPSIQLQPSAAAEFEAMVASAEADGIYLMPISGFRSIEDQQYLFFEIKAERAQSATTRAEVSAPPGYSEHHTGYAIDIGDADFPDTDLEISFAETPAFQWLVENAPRYSFELSFPEDNPQGIQYEPWHWRYVGDPVSLETFYQDP